MALNTRPVGITVIAVLAALGGIFMVFGGLAIIGLGAAGSAAGVATMRPGIGLLGALGSAGGVLVLAWGLAQLYVAYGAWNLKPWAWTWLLALSVIGLVVAVLSLRHSVLSLVINAVVLYYLNTPAVKQAFGRA